MIAEPFEVGRAVTSRQGHDRGRAFLVVALPDERYALIADGDTRTLTHPKKKQRKHLRPEPLVAAEALSPQHARAGTADAAIRKALSQLKAKGNAGADRMTDKEEYALVQK